MTGKPIEEELEYTLFRSVLKHIDEMTPKELADFHYGFSWGSKLAKEGDEKKFLEVKRLTEEKLKSYA